MTEKDEQKKLFAWASYRPDLKLMTHIPYEGRMRSIVYTGTKQRSLITHRPGIEIFECMPWHWYKNRMKSIGGDL